MPERDLSSASPMRQALGVVLGILLIAACCFSAYLLWGLFHHMVSGGQIRGRGFVTPAALAAVFLAVTAFRWHRSDRLQTWQMLGALAVAELGLAGMIGAVSGSYSLDGFFLSWFFGLGAGLALPWLAGMAASVLVGRSSRRRL